MAYTSWGTRKALGRRYSTDPAIIMEQQRLHEEYGLIPGREARGLQAAQFQQSFAENQRQFNKSEENKEDAASQAATAGMIGTAGNVALTGGMIRAMSKQPNEPFWGNWGGTPVGTTPTPTPTRTVNPAYIDAGTAGGMTGPGGVIGSAEEGFAASGAVTPSATPGLMGTVAPYAGPAAAGFTAGGLSTGVKEIGRIATLGMVKDKGTRDVLGGAAAGAAAGAAIGGIPTGGVGAPVGAVIGGILGGLGGMLGGGK